MQFENNLILYFFSMVPQVLGTMLALIGAFYLTRSDSIKTDIIYDIELFGNLMEDVHVNTNLNMLTKEQFNLYEKLQNFSRITPITTHLGILANNIKDIQHSNFKSINSETENSLYKSFCNREVQKLLIVHNKIRRHNNIKDAILKVYIIDGIILCAFILAFIVLPITEDNRLIFNIFLIIGILTSIFAIYLMINFIIYTLYEKIAPFHIFWKKWASKKIVVEAIVED